MNEQVIHKKISKDIPYVMNRSWIYLLPMIALSLQVSLVNMINLRGCFMFTEDFPLIEQKIILLFRADSDRAYINFESLLAKAPEFYSTYEPDKHHTVFIYNIPVEYKQEYNKFIESKYSEFSENYKKSLIKFHNYKDKPKENGFSVINVLYKREQAYLAQEKDLNEGLPYSSHIQIPRDQEIGKKWNETQESILLETYQRNMKVSELQV